MSTRKAHAWAILAAKLGTMFRDAPNQDTVVESCRAQGHDGIDPIGSYLTAELGMPCEVGGVPPVEWVQMRYDSGRYVSLTLPVPSDYDEPESKRPITGSSRLRLAQPLWDALDEAKIDYHAEPSHVEGMPSAALLDRKAAIFVRRCHSWQHGCKGGDEHDHKQIVHKLQLAGWTVYTLWECQITNGVHLPLLLSVLKG